MDGHDDRSLVLEIEAALSSIFSAAGDSLMTKLLKLVHSTKSEIDTFKFIIKQISDFKTIAETDIAQMVRGDGFENKIISMLEGDFKVKATLFNRSVVEESEKGAALENHPMSRSPF